MRLVRINKMMTLVLITQDLVAVVVLEIVIGATVIGTIIELTEIEIEMMAKLCSQYEEIKTQDIII